MLHNFANLGRVVSSRIVAIISQWHDSFSSLLWRHNGENASQTTSLTIVYSIVYSDADQRKHQSSASLAFVRGIHRGSENSPHKWPVTRKMFPFDDVIMFLNGSFSLAGGKLLSLYLEVFALSGCCSYICAMLGFFLFIFFWLGCYCSMWLYFSPG